MYPGYCPVEVGREGEDAIQGPFIRIRLGKFAFYHQINEHIKVENFRHLLMEDNFFKMFLTHFTNVGIFNFVGLLLIFSKAVPPVLLT